MAKKKAAKKVKKKSAKKKQTKKKSPKIKTNIQLKDAVEQDTKNLLWVVLGIVLVFVLFFSIRFILPDNEVKTIDDLHLLNLKGELRNDTVYVYGGHSFVKVGNLWYSQLQKGKTLFDVTFNYGPKEVSNVSVEGALTKDFIKSKKFYITFDPEGEHLKEVAVANYGLSNSLVRAFGFDLKAGCIKNATPDCANAEIITCPSKNKSVFYFKEAKEAKVMFNKTCVIIQGSGQDIIKAKDRLLLRWYGIMK